MLKLKVFLLIVAACLVTGEVFAECGAKKVRKKVTYMDCPSGRKSLIQTSRGDLENMLEDLEEEAEKLDRRLKRSKINSKKNAKLRCEREEVAMETLHLCQRYFISYGGKKRSDKIQEIMQKESALIKEALKDQEDFPIRELFDDYLNTLQKVRSGEIEFRGRKPNGYAALLGEIQKAQKKALETIHEKRLKKF